MAWSENQNSIIGQFKIFADIPGRSGTFSRLLYRPIRKHAIPVFLYLLVSYACVHLYGRAF